MNSQKKVLSKNSKNATAGKEKAIVKIVYTPFNDLRMNEFQNKTVNAKVLKVWVSENKKTGEVWSLEAHIMDEQGTQMQLKVNKDNMNLFQGKLLDGDVIGKLHSISNIVVKQVQEIYETRDVQMREICIANDAETTLKITLWGELADMIEDEMLERNKNVPVVVIVTGTFVREHMGLIILATKNASRVFVDLDVEQVHIFRQRLGDEPTEIEEVHLEQEKDPYEDKISLYEAIQLLLDYENKVEAHIKYNYIYVLNKVN
ncbi:hypothetical protein MKX03_026454 [Papaver bracteatum]|nr:hypothetical protein MKX03_026454 [Papaver bracteatum]